jgi:hypothetical protein
MQHSEVKTAHVAMRMSNRKEMSQNCTGTRTVTVRDVTQLRSVDYVGSETHAQNRGTARGFQCKNMKS